jgi:hypothetical protein
MNRFVRIEKKKNPNPKGVKEEEDDVNGDLPGPCSRHYRRFYRRAGKKRPPDGVAREEAPEPPGRETTPSWVLRLGLGGRGFEEKEGRNFLKLRTLRKKSPTIRTRKGRRRAETYMVFLPPSSCGYGKERAPAHRSPSPPDPHCRQ